MYELSRIRLYSVGPSGARYEDVTIDLSGAGAPVREPQPALWPEAMRRPSPASVLFLENGGGKSVLMKLIFSVMLPGRRRVVGTTNTKVLENFVGRGEVAHVALEWMHTTTGRLLVTGKISSWHKRGKQVGEDNLADVWYTLRPNDTLGLQSLPFAENGERLALAEFQSRLDDLHEADPALELDWVSVQAKWSERLDDLGLDPELFRYQREMNAGEGEAADTFSFNTDESFVNFLLKAVLPVRELDDLTDSIAEHSENLAKRGDLELEHAFVEQVLDQLGPLAKQRVATRLTEEQLATANGKLHAFTASLHARAEHERGRSKEFEQDVADRSTAVSGAKEKLQRAENIKAAIVYRTTELRFAAAKKAQEEAVDAKAEAERAVHGWTAVPKLISCEEATRNAAALRKVVGQQEGMRQAALEERNIQARALARALLAAEEAALEEADRTEDELGRLRESERAAEQSWTTAITAQAQASAVAAQLEVQVSEVDNSIEAAVRAGLCTSASELPANAETLAEQVRADSAEIKETEQVQQELEEAAERSRGELAQAREAEVAARSDHGTAEIALKRAQHTAAELGGDPRLLELLDTDAVELEYDLEVLLDQLAHAQGDIDRRRTELRVADAADAAARLIWEADPEALLPPHHEVARIQGILQSAGIDCWTGWEYLADRSDQAVRAELVRRLPHLAGGVLVNNPDHVQRAHDLIAEADHPPTGTVFIATTQSFDLVVAPEFDLFLNPEAGFVAPPNPALFDPEAARTELARISEEHEDRQTRLRELEARYRADQTLAARLTAWRTEYPIGALGDLADAVDSTESELRSAVEAASRAASALAEALQRRDESKARLTGMHRNLEGLKDRSRSLTDLAARSTEAQAWRREAVEARSLAETEQAAADALSKDRERLRLGVANLRRTADRYRDQAKRTREEIDRLPGGVGADPETPVPEEPVTVLRETLVKAQRVYDKAEVGDDQLKDLQQAEDKATEARRAWEAEPAEIRDAAANLLRSADGADTASRAAATTRAEDRLLDAQQDCETALTEVAKWKTRLDDLGKPVGALDDSEQPLDIAQGDQLIHEARRAVDRATERHASALDALSKASAALDNARTLAEHFELLAGSHSLRSEDQIGPHTTEVEPFSGDLAAARRRYGALHQTAERARNLARSALRILDERAERLHECVVDEQFDALSTPFRTMAVRVAPADRAEFAEEWITQLRPRLRALADDLAQANRYREANLVHLRGIVRDGTRVLAMAQKLSKLPGGLGDWTGLEFLQIRCTPVEGDLLDHELGRVLDDAIEKYRTTGKCDGFDIAQRAVRAAVPKGFKVTMLKPDKVLRSERVRVSEVRDVFSGGQHLTAAIILYCTLAALRANDRGKSGRRHSGVLFLDNPIGRASASYLLDLQRGVAAALGVQLVYTTGLFDEEALAGFPLVVRLRNDGDLRAGRKYLSVDKRIAQYLDMLPSPDGTGTLSSTRIVLPEPRHDDED